MSIRKKDLRDIELEKEDKIFCTECGEDLTEFVFSQKSKNKKGVKDNWANCKKIGRFKGEFCSKYFMVDDDLDDPNDELDF